MAGIKFDEEKNDLSLVPPEFIEAVGWVLTHGKNKYGAHNWREGLSYSRVYAAILRHLMAYARGEKTDKDSGRSHLWHCACELAFLIYFEEHPDKYKQFDDMYNSSKTGKNNGGKATKEGK